MWRREEKNEKTGIFGSWYQALHKCGWASTLIKANCLKLHGIIRRLSVSLLRHSRTATTKKNHRFFELVHFHLMKIRKKQRYLATIDVCYQNRLVEIFQLLGETNYWIKSWKFSVFRYLLKENQLYQIECSKCLNTKLIEQLIAKPINQLISLLIKSKRLKKNSQRKFSARKINWTLILNRRTWSSFYEEKLKANSEFYKFRR